VNDGMNAPRFLRIELKVQGTALRKAGTWVLLGEKDLTLGHLCLPLALVLTAGWIFSNLKSHGYVSTLRVGL